MRHNVCVFVCLCVCVVCVCVYVCVVHACGCDSVVASVLLDQFLGVPCACRGTMCL